MSESPYRALAESVRRLVDATIRTEVGPGVVSTVTSRVDAATAQLRAALMPGSFGERRVADGQPLASGNVVIGIRNPVAPPLTMHHEPDGSVWTEFILGAPYEGPPGHVHGGICAMVLDHVLGATAHQPGRPAHTGTLTLRYLRPTPLNWPLRAEARVDRVEGRKVFASGQIVEVSGATVSAEGIFILPRTEAD